MRCGRPPTIAGITTEAVGALTPLLLLPPERLIKQTITDNSPSVASAGLVSALFLMKDNGDVVKRWANEVNNQVRRNSPQNARTRP